MLLVSLPLVAYSRPMSLLGTSFNNSRSVERGTIAPADSAGISVVFSASGGRISDSGLYTAGAAAGTYLVIAAWEGSADTSAVKVSPARGSTTATGIPFGPFNAWNNSVLRPNTEVFSATIGSVNPRNILNRIAAARRNGVKLVLALTGGSHDNYLTNGVFDRSKWNTRMQSFNTSDITAAVAEGVADGTIIGNSVMDEPHVSGRGDGNTWGPRGTMTKARVDSLCSYVKTIFPTLPVGVVHRHDIFEPEKSYQACDFVTSQYSHRIGSVTEFRDGGLAMAKRDGHAIMFSINILNGGIQAPRNRLWNCPSTTTAGRGTYEPNCRMTAEQVRSWGILLGSAGCGLMMWQYEDTFMADRENQQAFKDVADRLAGLPAKRCGPRG